MQRFNEDQSATGTDPEFDRLLGQLMKDVRQHVSDEEGNLLPKLQQTYSTEE